MATTISRYLKLKIDDNLSADAKANLAKIDELGAVFRTNAEDNVDISAKGNISLQPGDPASGGTPATGDLFLGDTNNYIDTVDVYSAFFRLRSALRLRNSSPNLPETFFALLPLAEDANVSLTVGLDGANRALTIEHDGVVVVEDAPQTLTNKTLSGSSSVNITGNITTTGTITGATIAGLVSGSNVTGDISGNADNVNGTVSIAHGGTGATTADAALVNLLPSYVNAGTLKVKADGSGLEWVVGAGQGTVTSVTASSPLSVTGDPNLTPNIIISQASAGTNGYLTSTDWSTFNSKEPSIASGTTAQYWRGDKSWQTLDKAAVGLSNVDNTSDANKPISSAVSTALAGKYDASNPSAFIDAAGARSAVVVNSPTWTETAYAPSALAVANYVSSFSGGSYSTSWTPVANPTFTINHALSSQAITVAVYDAATNGNQIIIDTIDIIDSNNISVSATVADGTTPTWTVVIKK